MNTLTLNLDDKHNKALDVLSMEQDMSKSQILRQALRLYQMVYLRAKKGEQMAFVDKDGTVIPVIIVGLPIID